MCFENVYMINPWMPCGSGDKVSRVMKELSARLGFAYLKVSVM